VPYLLPSFVLRSAPSGARSLALASAGALVAHLVLSLAQPGTALAGCPEVLAALGDRVADVTCVVSADLTTNNVDTTPPNNSIAGLPAGAFTPITDRAVLSADPPYRTPITKAVPGLQINGRFTDDPAGQARFLLRLPADWNGRLVVAGAPGTRSEFASDYAWSDYVVQKGYAYASQNKGVLNLKITSVASPTPPAVPPGEPEPCRLNPSSQVWVQFYDNAADKPFTQWTHYIEATGKLAKRAVEAEYRRRARFTYAVGTSNGGYQVRRAVENAPEVFDGGVDWEGTFVDPRGPNLLLDLPAAIANFPAYVASGFDPNSLAAQNIVNAGYPPDVRNGAASLWALHQASFWEVTQCQWQKRFDPAHVTYAGGPDNIDNTGGYDYEGRVEEDRGIARRLRAVATTGKIKRPLITVTGTMDVLLPIKHSARSYEALVKQAACEGRGRRGRGHDDCDRDGDRDRHGRPGRGDRDDSPAYRLYEVQNGTHIETYTHAFPQLERIAPHAQRAFDLIVDHVERDTRLPPSQCIPRAGAISSRPSQRGHCAELLAP
jgi:hypothetical protein